VLNHIAFVMDGNRRWAKKQGLVSTQGHAQGVDTVKKVIEFCLTKGIRYVSLYTFSIENFKRSKLEKRFLFNLLSQEIAKGLGELIEKSVRVKFIGDRSLFPSSVVDNCQLCEKETASFDRLTVNFLFCYGGRQEIIDGIKKIACKVKEGTLEEDSISEDLFAQNLWSNGTPDPDLIVRTGGQKRLSNFLLYQAAYSELSFLDCFWPEITIEDLEQIYYGFMKRKRNFGK